MQEIVDRIFCKRPYAFKTHDATRLHYDLRLEWNGVLLSWAVPVGPSLVAEEVREAIEMEDHRAENILFEGVHETGTIMLWDRGAWAPQPGFEDVEDSLRNGLLQFTLYGEKLGGGWTLSRIRNAKDMTRPVWSLHKQGDLFARESSDICVLEEFPNSISSGKPLEKITLDWPIPKQRHEGQVSLFDARS